MSPKKHRTRHVSEAEAKSYLKKAEEFYQTMLESCRQRRWNSAGLAGVHCAISATDAALGFKAKVRSAGESHYEAVELLCIHIKHEKVSVQSARLTRILGQKSIVEYDSREFTEREASDITKDVGRYLDWVKTLFQ
ncbi:MAG: hypothetical protein Q7R35_17305 [Elusimicrobiota bacterium]|nr:hypothetical protein [Elusimicrobiota bacterium]